jgi:hypothetical protein
MLFFTWRSASGTVVRRMRLPLAVIAVIALGAGASAFAQTGGGSEQQEPDITAASVLRLTSAQRCVSPSRITVRAAPPAGVELELLRVAIEGRLATRMAGVRGRASITVQIPRGSSRVRVTARTLGGQEVHADRNYHACTPSPSRPEPPVTGPISRGGGED